jgi:hypothetical protein
MLMHFRKGSLLEYNGVYLAEGPWPGKAYFDALRRARRRDASTYIDYGFTRPSVISRGAYSQHSGTAKGALGEGPAPVPQQGEKIELQQPQPLNALPPQEVIPAPANEPLSAVTNEVTTVSYVETMPLALPAEGAPPTGSSELAKPAAAPSTPVNPFPRDVASLTPPAAPLPAVSQVVNPFTTTPLPTQSVPGEALPTLPLTAYEPQANNPPAEAPSNAASGSGRQR